MKKKKLGLKSFSLFFKAIANTKHEMWVSMQVLVVITIILSIILFVVEHAAQPKVYNNLWDSCLWAFMSYIGDPGHFAEFTPITFVGRIIAVLVGIIGIAIFAVPAGLIGSGFMDAIAESRKEEQMNEASVTLHKFFRRSGQGNSVYLNEEGLKRTYKCVPRFLSMAFLQVNGMTTDEIIATVNYCPDLRLSNLGSTIRISDKPQDRLVVEHFPLNREYGCFLDRDSNVTIIAASPKYGTGNFAFELAAMGGFNYVSKELSPDPEESVGFYTMNKSDIDIIADYDLKEDVESQALHYMYELRGLKKKSEARHKRHWFIYIFGTLKSVDCQVNFWRLATDKKKRMGNRIVNQETNRDYGSTVLGEDEILLQNIFQEIETKLKKRKVLVRDQEQNIVSQLDNTKKWKSANDQNIMVRMGGGVDCNAFNIRIGYEILTYCNFHLLIAKEMADAIKGQIEPDREIPEDAKKCFVKNGDGYADDYGKEDVFMKSPQDLKEMVKKGAEYARKHFEHLDLNENEQADFEEHQRKPWYKRWLGLLIR